VILGLKGSQLPGDSRQRKNQGWGLD